MDQIKPNCEKCDAMFTSTEELLQHIDEDHGSLKCPSCKYEAISDKSFRQHIKNHQIGARFTCKYCHFITRSMPNLKRHIQYIHSNERKFTCDYCWFATVEEHKLKEHMRVHSGERPFKCQTCRKNFKHLINLHRHLVTHTGDKNNICILCFQVFGVTMSLRNHLRKVHNLENVHIEGVRMCKLAGLPKTVELYINKLGVSKEFVLEKYSDLKYYKIKPIFALAYTKHFESVSPIIWEAENRVPSSNTSKAYRKVSGRRPIFFLADLKENKSVKNEDNKIATKGSKEQNIAVGETCNQEHSAYFKSEKDKQSNTNDQETNHQSLLVESEQTITMNDLKPPTKHTQKLKRAKTKKSDPWYEESPEEFTESDDEIKMNIELLLPNKRKRGLMLKKMKAGEFGPHPRVIKVLEDGTIEDTTESFKEFLPLQ